MSRHLLAIKSLQQKSSPEAILANLIEAWLILPVSEVLPQSRQHYLQSGWLCPKHQQSGPAANSACHPGQAGSTTLTCKLLQGRARALGGWGRGSHQREGAAHFSARRKEFFLMGENKNQQPFPSLHLFQAPQPRGHTFRAEGPRVTDAPTSSPLAEHSAPSRETRGGPRVGPTPRRPQALPRRSTPSEQPEAPIPAPREETSSPEAAGTANRKCPRPREPPRSPPPRDPLRGPAAGPRGRQPSPPGGGARRRRLPSPRDYLAARLARRALCFPSSSSAAAGAAAAARSAANASQAPLRSRGRAGGEGA